MNEDFYMKRRGRLLRDFDRSVRRVQGVLSTYYDRQAAKEMITAARQEYETIIPQLPYIGGRQPFTQFLISTGWILAMYRAMKRQGISTDEIGVRAYQTYEAFLKNYPQYLRRYMGFMTFSPRYLRKLRQRAAESHLRRYPDDYVYDFIEGDGTTFDYGVDYLECATCKFLKAQGALDLTPYICTADILYSRALDWGLRRTMTLAEGDERCDFRFKRGGETNVATPKGFEKAMQRYAHHEP